MKEMCFTNFQVKHISMSLQIICDRSNKKPSVLYLWYSSDINVSDDCLKLALKCGIMSIGITATDWDAKREFF